MPSGPEWIIVLVVVLVVFGGSQLPKLAKNFVKAQKEFKDGLAESQNDTPNVVPPVAPVAVTVVDGQHPTTD
jgi:sec-independent protein translocase protein TatA